MRAKYENVILYNSELTIEQIKYRIHDWVNAIKDCGGKVVKVEDIGIRKLAYEVKSHKEAYYVIYHFYTDADEIANLERMLRISSDVLKFITLRMEDDDKTESAEEEYVLPGDTQSEQDSQPDALDVLLGLAEYKKKVSC